MLNRPLFARDDWQMSLGERAALVGLLEAVEPRLAIEIGSLTGGSLDVIASVADEVHSFDITPQVDMARYPNVTFHVGDSHVLLPKVLSSLASAGRNVDLALVDGDHSEEGVLADVTDLLASDALQTSVIALHDVANESVRAGLRRVEWRSFQKVRQVEIDAVPGRLLADGPAAGQWWGGLGLVVVDSNGAWFGPVDVDALVEAAVTMPDPDVRREDLEVALAAARLDARHQREAIVALKASHSWRVTAPLRRLGGIVRRTRHGVGR